jgi:hypothetical protein
LVVNAREQVDKLFEAPMRGDWDYPVPDKPWRKTIKQPSRKFIKHIASERLQGKSSCALNSLERAFADQQSRPDIANYYSGKIIRFQNVWRAVSYLTRELGDDYKIKTRSSFIIGITDKRSKKKWDITIGSKEVHLVTDELEVSDEFTTISPLSHEKNRSISIGNSTLNTALKVVVHMIKSGSF